MTQKKYFTADRETGTLIDEFGTYEEALNAITEYEREDKEDGLYTPRFYDIVNEELCTIAE